MHEKPGSYPINVVVVSISRRKTIDPSSWSRQQTETLEDQKRTGNSSRRWSYHLYVGIYFLQIDESMKGRWRGELYGRFSFLHQEKLNLNIKMMSFTPQFQ